jgi:hypothetical protein
VTASQKVAKMKGSTEENPAPQGLVCQLRPRFQPHDASLPMSKTTWFTSAEIADFKMVPPGMQVYVGSDESRS